MSYLRLWAFGGAALLACAASFWGGREFAARGGPAAAPAPTGGRAMTDMPQPSAGEPARAGSGELTCSLTPEELEAQREQLIPGLFKRAEKVEDIPDGLRFRFRHRPQLVAELAAVVERERVCCSFLSFRLLAEKGKGPITLEVTGPAGTARKLRKS
jgi:hypothetical protein